MRDVLRTAIRVMDQRAVALGLPGVQRLLQRVEHEVGVHRAADPPADDAPGEDVDDEGHVQPALPGRDVGEVRDPQLVRPLGPELPVHPSSGHGALASLTVVRTTLPRTTPRRPKRRISRSTVQRATATCLRGAVAARPCRRRRPACWLATRARRAAPARRRVGRAHGAVPACAAALRGVQ